MTIYIYARVSTNDQNVDQQAKVLTDQYKHDQVIKEKGSGKTLDRPLFSAMADKLVSGDSVIVYDISRLGRNTTAVLDFVARCKGLGVKVAIHDLGGLDVCSNTGKMVLTVLAGVAEMMRGEMLEKQMIGIQTAKEAGKYRGKQQSPETVKKLDKAISMMAENGLTQGQAAKLVGISRATLSRHLNK